MNTFKETSPSLKLRLKSLVGSPAKSPRQSTSCRPAARCHNSLIKPLLLSVTVTSTLTRTASVYYLHTSKVCLKNFLEVEKVLHSFEDIQIKWTVFAATNKIDSTQYPHSETGTEVHQMMDLLAAKISTKLADFSILKSIFFFLFHRQPQH